MTDSLSVTLIDTIDSTHLLLKNLISDESGADWSSIRESLKGVSWSGVRAKGQTNGVGQYASDGSNRRKWVSEMNSGIFLSMTRKIEEDPTSFSTKAMKTAFELGRRVQKYIQGHRVQVKWPNDIVIDHKKVGGILTEVINNRVICSVGLNVRNMDWREQAENREWKGSIPPASIKDYIKDEYKDAINYDAFIETMEAECKEAIVDGCDNENSLDSYVNETSLYSMNELIEVHELQNGVIVATIVSVNNDGGLMIQAGDGTMTIYTGRIMRLNGQY